mgnify:FL=1
MTDKPYNEDWIEYYEYLEQLRQSGATNMFGATTYLRNAFQLDRHEARDILVSWMENYDQLVADGICVRD